jgi:uncharacterized membrane protein (DUF485 family)
MEHTAASPVPGLDDPPIPRRQVTRHPELDDPRFRTLVRERRTFAWTLTVVMLTIYFSFILTLAFRPAMLGHPIVSGQPMTWGIPVGFTMFVVTFALVALYVHRANAVYDMMAAQVRRGVEP